MRVENIRVLIVISLLFFMFTSSIYAITGERDKVYIENIEKIRLYKQQHPKEDCIIERWVIKNYILPHYTKKNLQENVKAFQILGEKLWEIKLNKLQSKCGAHTSSPDKELGTHEITFSYAIIYHLTENPIEFSKETENITDKEASEWIDEAFEILPIESHTELEKILSLRESKETLEPRPTINPDIKSHKALDAYRRLYEDDDELSRLGLIPPPHLLLTETAADVPGHTPEEPLLSEVFSNLKWLFILILALASLGGGVVWIKKKNLNITNTQIIAILTVIVLVFWTMLASPLGDSIFGYNESALQPIARGLVNTYNPEFIMLLLGYLIIIVSGIFLLYAFRERK
jgi:hypothetical protein